MPKMRVTQQAERAIDNLIRYQDGDTWGPIKSRVARTVNLALNDEVVRCVEQNLSEVARTVQS